MNRRMDRAALAVLFCIAAAAASVAAPAPDTSGLETLRRGRAEQVIVLASGNLQQLVVVDAGLRKIVLYRVSTTSIDPVLVRDLDTDIRAGLAISTTPSADAPGADIEDAPRPPNAIRVGSSHDDRDQGETWSADYVVTGEVPTVYASIRASMERWNLVQERLQTGPAPVGTMHFQAGPRTLMVDVSGDQSGYVMVRYRLRAP